VRDRFPRFADLLDDSALDGLQTPLGQAEAAANFRRWPAFNGLRGRFFPLDRAASVSLAGRRGRVEGLRYPDTVT
jgi:hypothetical protein